MSSDLFAGLRPQLMSRLGSLMGAANAITSVMPRTNRLQINSYGGFNFDEATRQMDGRGVRSGMRSPLRVLARPAQYWAHRFWRLGAICVASLRNAFDRLEHQNQLQKGSAFLGSHGRWLRDVVLRTGFVDLFRGLPAAGCAQPVCRRCSSISAHRSHDGRAGGAAARATERPLPAARIPRLLSAADLVAVSL